MRIRIVIQGKESRKHASAAGDARHLRGVRALLYVRLGRRLGTEQAPAALTATLALALVLAFPFPRRLSIARGRLAAARVDFMRAPSKMGHVWHVYTEHPPPVRIDDLLRLLDRMSFCACTGQPCCLAGVNKLLAGDLMGWRCISVG